MLEEVFQDVYTKFKLHFYQNVFQRFATREATLTTVESFCMEGIMAMGEPTIAEFSRMMGISTPNAAYKIGSLVKKGYVEKIQSTTDRREYFLRPTQKYIDYYSISYSYLHTVIERVRKRFPAEDCDKMEQMLSVISTELMPELDMLAKCRHPEAPKSEEYNTAQRKPPAAPGAFSLSYKSEARPPRRNGTAAASWECKRQSLSGCWGYAFSFAAFAAARLLILLWL